MDYKKAKPAPQLENLEVCINLWWFVDDESGLVFHIAGRGYALSGDDSNKLQILKKLSSADFHIAGHHKIPERFTINSEHGTIRGVVPASAIKEHPEIFEPVYLQIEKDMPQQVQSVNGEYQFYKMKVPEDPLCVITCVVEYSDGRLVPMIS